MTTICGVWLQCTYVVFVTLQVVLLWEVTTSAVSGCWRYVSTWKVTASVALGWLRYVSTPYLFCSPPPSFILLGFWVRNRFLYKPFSKTLFVGLKESTSLWVVIPVEVRLPTAGSPQITRKRDLHWELLLLLLLFSSQKIKKLQFCWWQCYKCESECVLSTYSQ